MLKFLRALYCRKPGSEIVSSALEQQFSTRRASALRSAFREVLDSGHPVPPIEALLAHAASHGWDVREQDKLRAYHEFYSDQAAAAWQRVYQGNLARDDYQLFITACVHCYLYDRFEEGYKLLRQFDADVAADIDWAEFLAYAGYIAYAGGGTIKEAVAYFDQALEHELYSPLLVVNAYLIYFEAGAHAQVEHLRRVIHERYATDPEAEFTLACVELARDYYPEGFRLAEARYRMPEVSRAINTSLLARPRWNGESLSGKRLLVHGEQGYGDLFMMSRYLPLLQAKGADVVLDCREPALELMRYNFPGCEFVEGDQKSPLPASFDLWTGIMSLPFHFDTTAETVPSCAGYMKAPPEQTEYWQDRLKRREGLRVGVAWSGNPAHRADRRRSLSFELLAPHVRKRSDLKFFTLQTNVPEFVPSNLINTADELVTLADTFALISQLDLVITVDTSVVHIAGALGKPTWLLLPYRYEWRWGLQGEKNNWYQSVRVLRQESHGEWDKLLGRVFDEELNAFIESHGGRGV